GTPLGMVGTTGNARGTPPHLHYGVYGRNGVYDPLPLLRKPAPQPEN
ncbi:M23 family peptidase, partial [Xanthomonas oryzae pv. oryzae]